MAGTPRGRWFAVGAALAVLGGALAVVAALTPDLFLVEVGSQAPDFRAVDLGTRDTVGMSRYRGRVMLLNIWATWCKPCEEEMPAIERLHQTLGPAGLAVVAVSIDETDPESVRAWAAQRGLTFTILQDRRRRIERDYQTTGVPESFVIDRSGIIVKKLIGPVAWDHPAQQVLIRRLLAGPPNAGSE